MRIWGWILLILGIVFLILFTLAEFGGGHLGFLPFFISLFLMIMGGRFISSGKGIVQSQPAGAAPASSFAAQPTVPGSIGAPGQFTVELPLTPDVSAVIAAQSARNNRVTLWVIAGSVAFFLVLAIVLSKTAADNATQSKEFLLIFFGIGVIFAAMIYSISWFTSQRPVRRDLRGTTYLSTTGPVSVVRIGNGTILRLADRAFVLSGRAATKELRALGHGRVDYSPHGHIILAAWDRNGRNVYSLPGYGPASGT